MAINVNAIGEYVSHNGEQLIAKAVLAPITMGMVTIQSGIKYKDELTFLSTDVNLQDGSSCGFRDEGTSTITKKDIEVAPIKVNMTWCPRDLEKTIMGQRVNSAAGKENLPYEEKFINGVTESIQQKVEKALWVGDVKDGGHFDGLLTRMKASEAVIKPANTKAINATNIESIIETVVNAIPDTVLGKAEIFVGIDTFRVYQQFLVKKNLFHYEPEKMEQFRVVIPGTNIYVTGLEALNGTKALVGCDPKNLVVGTDMENDAEVYDFWFSKDTDEFKLNVRFKLGTQIFFEDEVALVMGA